MKKRLISILILSIFIMTASKPLLVYDMLFPVIKHEYNFNKFGLAWAYQDQTPNAPDLLGLTCFHWHRWSAYADSKCHNKIPYLTGNDLAEFLQYFPQDYDGNIFVFNECDRPDQCNQTVSQMISVLFQAQAHCPNCQWIGPHYSNACYSGICTANFFQAYVNAGGQMNKFYGHGMHIYPSPDGLSALAKLNVFCQNVVCDKPVWVTEIGATNAITPTTFKTWLLSLANDKRVAYIFGYAPWSSVPYKPFLTSNGTGLTNYGTAFRSAMLEYQNGYP